MACHGEIQARGVPQGLKPALILGALRGADAPLFHGAARICGFSATSEAAPFPNAHLQTAYFAHGPHCIRR